MSAIPYGKRTSAIEPVAPERDAVRMILERSESTAIDLADAIGAAGPRPQPGRTTRVRVAVHRGPDNVRDITP